MRFPSIFSVTSIIIFHVMTSIIKAEIRRTNLSCNFDDGTLCEWRSDSDLCKNTTDRQFILDGLYAYAKGGIAVLAEGHLISAEVEEYNERQAILSFSYWKSNNISKLDVCVAQQNAFICTYTAPDTVGKEMRWIKQNITLSNNLSIPYKIVFRARNIRTPSDIVAIDEIEYSNSPPKAFASLISRNEISKKILSNKQAISASCLPVQCTFINSTCAWTLEAPWHRLEGNIAMDTEGESQAKSGFFSVPADAFFEMDVWMSENALLTILENMGNKLMIWSRKGSHNGDGWYRLRIPIKASKQPIQLLLKGIVPPNNFITISDTKLVNKDGNEINCGISTPNSIKLRFNNTERLIALQQLHTNQIKPTTMILRYKDNKSAHALNNNIIQTKNFYSGTSFTAPMISSNNTLVSRPKVKEIRKSLASNDKIGKHLKNQSGLSSGFINGPTKPTLPLLSFRQYDGPKQRTVTFIRSSSNKSYTERPIINHYMRPSDTTKHNVMKELNSLLSQIGGQPVLEMQLQRLAQHFGFSQIDAEQSLELLKNFMNSKGMKSKTAELLTGADQEPIRPINAPSHFIPDMQLFPHNGQFNSLLSLFSNELRKKFVGESKGLFGRNLNDETMKHLDSVLPVPLSNTDTQLPLTRNQFDFIVHNTNIAGTAPIAPLVSK